MAFPLILSIVTALPASFENGWPLFDINERALVRRIDYRIVPLMFFCYLMQFLDKILINYANVMGLAKDAQLKGNELLGFNVILWGTTVACTAACSSFRSLLAVRIILGVLEAVISPALVLITSTWYQRKEASPRYGIWYCGLGGGQIFGGLLSFAFQHVTSTSFQGWRLMFVVVGAVNIVVGLLVVFFLPAKPQAATFLSNEGKSFVLDRLAVNQAGIENSDAKPRQIFEAFKDAQILLLCLITILCSLSSGVITTFSATLIKGFGYDGKQSALLNIPSGVISILSTIFATIAIGRGYARWASIVVLVVPVTIGGALMSFLNKKNEGGLLTGIYMINCTTVILVIVYSWVGSNVAGYSKKITANGMVAASFAIANIIGPQTFQAHDAPQFPSQIYPSQITILVVAAFAGVAALALRMLLGVWNNKRDQSDDGQGLSANELISLDLTGSENKHFRYTY
ncbi:putative allantoate permease [Hyaloscypha bicolor E]|uniref:Putative allantoate permease n=1 Tax=Hyaloscypha bicolor E TaxID=1095630 RepID=A0A2J6T7J1_9HELO|nr:putative allantoate permease [Hyaloscypha bicolor E]PMD58991.1 putative allantoate permease [Hyaloscypha bicolor E]